MHVYNNVFRGRYLYEKNIWTKIKEDEYLLKLIDVFFSTWMFNIVKYFKIFLIVINYKNTIILNNKKC